MYIFVYFHVESSNFTNFHLFVHKKHAKTSLWGLIFTEHFEMNSYKIFC